MLTLVAVVAGVVLLGGAGWYLQTRADGAALPSSSGTAAPTATDRGSESAAAHSPSPQPTAPATGAPSDAPASAPAAPGAPAPASTPGGSNQAGARTPVDVVVVSSSSDEKSGDVSVSGYATTVEENGTCTVSLSSGATSVTVDGPAAPDATTVSCGELVVPRSRLGQGTWQGTLRYSSATSAGTSLPFTIEVH